MSIFVLAKLNVRQGQLDRTLERVTKERGEVLTQVLKKVGESANGQNEPGTLVYTICQDPQDEHKITIWEEYQDEAAAAHHRKQKEFIALASESKNLLDGALDIKVLRKARL